MTIVQIFGFGSLVNSATHAHAIRPARAHGWRRIWREVAGQSHAILSVQPAEDHAIDGVIMRVPLADLPALDARETGYARSSATVIEHASRQPVAVEIYIVTPHLLQATTPILRSYLDVVLSGYSTQFGAAAPADFYASTDGWHLPVHEDRTAPDYPRAQPHSPQDMARWDALHRAEARVSPSA